MSKTHSPYYTLKTNTQTYDVFMSFGLLNQLSRFFENIDDLSLIFLDSEVKGSILIECLSERDKRGRITNELDLMALDISNEDLNDFLAWVEGHLSDFFIQALKTAKQTMQLRVQKLSNQTSTSST